MPTWSQKTALAFVLMLSACAAGRSSRPQTPRDGEPIQLATASPANSTSSAATPGPPIVRQPAADLTSPRTPAERLAEAHREHDVEPERPIPRLRANDIEHRQPPDRDKTDHQIQVLERLIATSQPSDPDYPDLLFRLGATFLDLEAHHQREVSAQEALLREARTTGHDATIEQLQHRANKHREQAHKASMNAVKVYRALVSNKQFARYTRLDEALFRLGLELGDLDRRSEMQEAYLRLIREHPDSPAIPYAYVSFGDYYLNRDQLPEAEKLYSKITSSYQDNPVYAYALYKQAWVHLLQGKAETEGAFVKSLEEFVRVIEVIRRDERGLANQAEILRSARQGLVEAYVYVARPQKAWTFFERVAASDDDDELRETIERLAFTHFRKRQYPQFIYLHQQLQQRYPGDPRGCEWQWQIFVGYLADEDPRLGARERDELLRYRDLLASIGSKSLALQQCEQRIRDAGRVTLGVGDANGGTLVVPVTAP